MLPDDNAARKALPVWTYMFEYFPDAFLAEVVVAVSGNQQHNPGQPLHWAREKSTDQLNTALRHQFDYAQGQKKDTDGQWHLAKAVWRLKAQLQLDIEAERAEAKAAAQDPNSSQAHWDLHQAALDDVELPALPALDDFWIDIGSRVRVVTDKSSLKGMVGTVHRIWSGNVDVVLDDAPPGSTGCLLHFNLGELALCA